MVSVCVTLGVLSCISIYWLPCDIVAYFVLEFEYKPKNLNRYVISQLPCPTHLAYMEWLKLNN